MPASTDFLPSREADLVTWSNNLNDLLVAGGPGGAYGISAAQVTAYSALNSAWQSAYATANNNSTRTPSSIQAKNIAKENLVRGPGGIRELVAIIQANPATTDEQRSDLQITVRDTEPTPIPVPTVAPEIDFLPTGTRTIRIRLHNEATLNRAKPEGVHGASLFYFVGAAAPIELEEWTFYTNTTRTAVDVNLPAEVAAGSQVWFTAFWRNPKDEAGPATTPVNTIVQFGGLAEVA